MTVAADNHQIGANRPGLTKDLFVHTRRFFDTCLEANLPRHVPDELLDLGPGSLQVDV